MYVGINVVHDYVEITAHNDYKDSIRVVYTLEELESLMDKLNHAWLEMTEYRKGMCI